MFRVRRDLLDQLDLVDNLVPLAPQVVRVQLGYLETQDLQVRLDCREIPDQLELQAQLALQVQLD